MLIHAQFHSYFRSILGRTLEEHIIQAAPVILRVQLDELGLCAWPTLLSSRLAHNPSGTSEVLSQDRFDVEVH
jgi:hypothetical protein